jgi:hypothetical protein
LSKDSIHLIYQICDVLVFLRKRMLVYVLAIPLVSKGHFDVLNVVPVPVVLGDKNLRNIVSRPSSTILLYDG